MTNERSPSDVWSRLNLFSSRDVLARRYAEQHGREINAGKAKEIIAHLAQAREYFDSAGAAGALVKPLLQYYGVLALARAITLFRMWPLREATLRAAHGLSAGLSKESSLSSVVVTFTQGTFLEFLHATKNVQEMQVNYGPTIQIDANNWYDRQKATRIFRPCVAPTAGASCSFDDLVSRMPALKQLYEESFDRAARCYGAIVTAFGTYTNLSILPDRRPLPASDALITALGLGAESRCWASADGGLYIDVQHESREAMLQHLPHIVPHKGGVAAWYVVEPHSGRWQLSDIAALFVGSYILSTFVRYHPTQWSTLASGDKGDAILPVLLKLCDLVQAQFPRLALKELALDFRTPAKRSSIANENTGAGTGRQKD